MILKLKYFMKEKIKLILLLSLIHIYLLYLFYYL